MSAKDRMTRHFVTFYSPGTFMAEDTTKQITAWDVRLAARMAEKVEERYGARPYAFVFSTQERGPKDFEPKETKRSGTYYLPHCKVETLEEIKKRNDPAERILVSNMECNGWPRVVSTTKGWRWTQPLKDKDFVLTKKDLA